MAPGTCEYRIVHTVTILPTVPYMCQQTWQCRSFDRRHSEILPSKSVSILQPDRESKRMSRFGKLQDTPMFKVASIVRAGIVPFEALTGTANYWDKVHYGYRDPLHRSRDSAFELCPVPSTQPSMKKDEPISKTFKTHRCIQSSLHCPSRDRTFREL